MFDAQHFQNRRLKLAQELDDHSVVVLFSGRAPHQSADAAYHFHVNRNFYYLTGIDAENAALFISKDDGRINTTLFVETVDPVEEKWTGKRLSGEDAKQISGVDTALSISEMEPFVGRQLYNGMYDLVYIDVEQGNWNQGATSAHRFATILQDKYPTVRLANVYPTLCRMRNIKDESEVAAIREAISVTKIGIESMWANALAGMFEYELEAHFNYALNSRGVKHPAFHTIVAGGERATVLHYVDNNQPIHDGDLILLDLGATHRNYAADISRTFPVSGKFSPRQRELYNIVLTAMEETIAAIKPGVTTSELKEVTKASLARDLKRIRLITTDEEVDNYFYHGVSHPLGLDTHDVGTREWPIQPGSVITVEPGLYIAEEGIGIRIEDDVLVTADGCINLSKDILKTADEIEAFMAGR